jgi:hypothetical protein
MAHRFLTCLLSLLLTAAAFGAEPEEPAAPEGEPDAAQSATASADDVDAAMAEEIRAAEEAAANAPAADPNESFVPTIQISEDLSVSFPVDI